MRTDDHDGDHYHDLMSDDDDHKTLQEFVFRRLSIR